MEKYQKDAIIIQDSHIEFNTDSLKEFHKYYFNIYLIYMILLKQWIKKNGKVIWYN